MYQHPLAAQMQLYKQQQVELMQRQEHHQSIELFQQQLQARPQ
jgi:hypothetical protein